MLNANKINSKHNSDNGQSFWVLKSRQQKRNGTERRMNDAMICAFVIEHIECTSSVARPARDNRQWQRRRRRRGNEEQFCHIDLFALLWYHSSQRLSLMCTIWFIEKQKCEKNFVRGTLRSFGRHSIHSCNRARAQQTGNSTFIYSTDRND